MWLIFLVKRGNRGGTGAKQAGPDAISFWNRGAVGYLVP